MSTPGQVVIDSLNGKNSKGAAVVGGAVAVLGNGLLSATSPVGTIVLTGMSNMYLSFATFRETSKKVSEAVRESVGHDSPQDSSGWVRFYRYGVPFLLIAGVGGLALSGYAVATVAASQIAGGASTGVGMSSALATGIGWASSVLIPAGTLITSLWWNKEAPDKVKELLRSDPSFIDNIDVNFPELADLESFGHGDTFKNFLEAAAHIGQHTGQQTLAAARQETTATVTRVATQAQNDFIQATNALDGANHQLNLLNRKREALQNILGAWRGTETERMRQIELSIGRLDDMQRGLEQLRIDKAAVQEMLRDIHAPSEEAVIGIAIERTREELRKARDILAAAREASAIQAAEQNKKQVQDKLDALNRISSNLNLPDQYQVLAASLQHDLRIQDVRHAQVALDKQKQELQQIQITAQASLLRTRNEISNIEGTIPGLESTLNKKRAVKERVGRAVDALESQIAAPETLAGTLRPIVTARYNAPPPPVPPRTAIQSVQATRDALLVGELQPAPAQDLQPPQLGPTIVDMPAFDHHRASQTPMRPTVTFHGFPTSDHDEKDDKYEP